MYKARADCFFEGMFFIWTSEGGPLQYVGIGLFLLQMIPRMFPDLTTITLLALVVPSSILMATAHAWQSGALEQTYQQFVQWRDRSRGRMVGLTVLMSSLVGALVIFLMYLDPYWLSVLSQLLALGVVLYTHFYGPERVGGGFPPRRSESQSERASRQSKLDSIAQLVQAMPVEPFVPPENVHTDCSIAQLKQMLKRRGVTDKELDLFVDRQNLEETLVQKRKYSDSCCICFEPFEVGEPLRVLPGCHHELHMECLDKWAYTFANAVKRQHDPSCPLCKAKL